MFLLSFMCRINEIANEVGLKKIASRGNDFGGSTVFYIKTTSQWLIPQPSLRLFTYNAFRPR
jgi:hypothetical protein